MGTKDYRKLEQKVINIIKLTGHFIFNNKEYKLVEIGKPQSQGSGEPKTDVYILGMHKGEKKELKLSLKLKSTNEFQENKINSDRAESLFGKNYAKIIEDTALNIKHLFESQPLIYVSGRHPIRPNSITMGWKLELANKPRKLSSPLQLSKRQIRDYIYKGTNLPDDKKNSLVNGKIVENSGVANYMLYAELHEINSVEDIFEKIKPIDSIDFDQLYLIFTANNFRSDKEEEIGNPQSTKSTDGKRPLAVRIEWKYENGKLKHEILYNKPCRFTGYDMKFHLLDALKQLKKCHPSELSDNDLYDPSIILY